MRHAIVSVVVPLRVLIGVVCAVAIASAQPFIVDTDAGSDDVLAVSLLLAHHLPTAITVVNGMAHVDAGARNMRQLLEAAGMPAVRVYEGRSSPLRGSNEFPADWRTISDELPGVQLPAPARPPETLPAADYLVRRLRIKQPKHARILALGPLTNIAEALQQDPSIAQSIFEIVIMGGAIHGGNVPGRSAEWNIYIDPLAAQIVFRSGVPIRLITLNAAKRVPIGADFVREFESMPYSALGEVVARVLDSQSETIAAGQFYAWDPLAAAALLDARVVRTDPVRIDITDDGRTIPSRGPSNVKIATEADARAFRKLFMQSFSEAKAQQR